MTLDLATVAGPIAKALIPGWSVTYAWATQAELDAEIPGALAICKSTPTRSLATVRAVSPWPESESLAETLWHELTHAAWSPLTSLIPVSDGAAMVEEQIVERFGVLLASLAPRARSAVLRAVHSYAPASARARISALAPRARGGRQMDPTLIKAALEALIAGDAEKCAEILKGLVVSAAAGGEPAMPAEPDGEAGKLPAPAADPAADPSGPPPPAAKLPAPDDEKSRVAARKAIDMENDANTKELAAIVAAARPAAKEGIVVGLRARLGAGLTPAAEKLIMAAPTFVEAQKIAAMAEAMGAGVTRARSGADEHAAAAAGPVAIDEAALAAEGFSPQWIREYVAEAKRDQNSAAALLAGGRVARARLRKAS